MKLQRNDELHLFQYLLQNTGESCFKKVWGWQYIRNFFCVTEMTWNLEDADYSLSLPNSIRVLNPHQILKSRNKQQLKGNNNSICQYEAEANWRIVVVKTNITCNFFVTPNLIQLTLMTSIFLFYINIYLKNNNGNKLEMRFNR